MNKKKNQKQQKQVVMVRPPPLPSRKGAGYAASQAEIISIREGSFRQKPKSRQPRVRRGGPASERQSLGRAGGRSLTGGVGVKKTQRIREREFIATIAGSTGYAVGQSIALNPGLVASFPWLSIEAAGWESYRFNRLRFCYYTRKGSSTDGSVIMGADYDAADSAPPDEATFVTYQGVKEFAPWMDEVCVDLDAAQLNKIGKYKFVRTGPLQTNMVLADVDSGNFFVATTGMADTSNVGKLWVEYDVTFQTKQKTSPTTAPVNSKVAYFWDAAPVAYTTNTTVNDLFATSIANPLGAVNTAGSIVLPTGNYLVDVNVNMLTTTSTTTAADIVLNKNGAAVTFKPALSQSTGAGSLQLSNSAFVTSNGSDAFVVAVHFVGGGTLTYQGQIRIVAV